MSSGKKEGVVVLDVKGGLVVGDPASALRDKLRQLLADLWTANEAELASRGRLELSYRSDELGLMAAMLTLPDGNTVMGIAGCYAGDLEAGEKVLKPLRSFGSPMADHFQRMPYTAFQKALDWWAVPEQQHYWKSSFMRELPD